MSLTYERIEWVDAPDMSTPLSAENLNKMDVAIAKIIEYLNNSSSGDGRVHSHVGMIVQSTTLDTAAKVIAEYGGTEWQQITGRFLLAADGANYPVTAMGGSADAVVPSHVHTIGNPTSSTSVTHQHAAWSGDGEPLPVYAFDLLEYGDAAPATSGQDPLQVVRDAHKVPLRNLSTDEVTQNLPVIHSHSCGSTGVDGEGKNMPPYLAVYTWLRTA